jgi:hypothetical protein
MCGQRQSLQLCLHVNLENSSLTRAPIFQIIASNCVKIAISQINVRSTKKNVREKSNKSVKLPDEDEPRNPPIES